MKDRISIKAEARDLIRTGQVSPLLVSAIVIVFAWILDNITMMTEYDASFLADLQKALESGELYVPSAPAPTPMSTFLSVLITLVITVLYAGYYSYCMGIRRSQAMPAASLLDGLGIAGKVIWCDILMSVRIALWSMLFVIPGIVAAYRYRFAMYNLINDPSLTASQAIALSCRQTLGMKMELFVLDLSFIGWRIAAMLTLGLLNVWVLPYATLSDLGYYEEALRRMTS